MARGYAWYNPGEDSATDCLWRGDCDSAMIIASDPGAHFPGPSLRHMAKIPVIQIDPYANPTTEFADIVIPTAVSGIDAEGSVYRMDNIPIRLRKIIDSDVPTDEEIVGRILTEIRALRAKEVQ